MQWHFLKKEIVHLIQYHLIKRFNTDDLAIGVRGDDVPGKDDAGGVNVIYGTQGTTGLHALHNQFWHQDLLVK